MAGRVLTVNAIMPKIFLILIFALLVIFSLSLFLSKYYPFWTNLLWLLLGAFVTAIATVALSRIIKWLENPIALYQAGDPEVSIERTGEGEYAYNITIPIEIEARRGGKVSLETISFKTNIGRIESSRNKTWTDVPKGARLYYAPSCRFQQSDVCHEIKGKLKIFTKRGEKASLKFTAHAKN